MPLKVVTASTGDAVTRAEAKAYLRVDHTDEDTLIDGLLTAATEVAEAHTRRVFMPRTLRLLLDDFPHGADIELPRAPLRNTTGVQVRYQAQGSTALTAFASTNYIADLDSVIPKLRLKDGVSWPTATVRSINAVWVDFPAGYAGSSTVPEGVKSAQKLLVSHWYENRDTVLVGSISKPLEFTVDTLLAPYVVPYVA